MGTMQVRNLTDGFGSEITGLDPDQALNDPALGQQLQHLFDTRGVLVFRDLEIDQPTQSNIIRRLIGLGPLPPGETGSARATGEPFYVSNREPEGGAPYGRLLFHSDMMWSDDTFRVLSLYGIQIDPGAAGTLFASAALAWETLPEHLKEKVAALSAIQGHSEGARAEAANDPDVLVSKFENEQTRTTDVAYEHPHTGQTLLYVSQQMTNAIVGLEHDESEQLLEELFAHLYREESLYEHQWRTNDLVAWDNIAIQHARRNVAIDGPVRTLRKLFAPIPKRGPKTTRPSFSRAGQGS